MTICFLATSCKDNDYRKACEEHDFAKAYKIASNLEYNKEKQEALHYIVLQEALYVLEQQGESGILRLGVIMKENKAYWLPSELLDIVRQTNDEALIECLEKLDESSGNYLKPEKTSIIGVLNGYFEIVDDKYQVGDLDDIRGYKLRINIKYTKQIPQMQLNKWKKDSNVGNPNVHIYVDLTDKNGNVLNYDDWSFIEIKEIESLKIGDDYQISIYFDKELLGIVKAFKLRSVND